MTDTFGDFDVDDALDTEPADAEQVARKLHELRLRAEVADDGRSWDELEGDERGVRIEVLVVLLAWLRRQGAHP
jgi:hypothetical protein